MLSIIFLAPIVSSADDTINGHYCYTFGDNESLKDAKEVTRSLAIKNAVESYRIFVTSTSNVNNYQITNDLVQVISSGYLKDLKVKKHSENGRKICDTIEAKVSPQEVENALREAMANLGKNEVNSSSQDDAKKIESLYDELDEFDLLDRKYISIVNAASQYLDEGLKLYDSAPADDLSTWRSRMSGAKRETMDAITKILEASAYIDKMTQVFGISGDSAEQVSRGRQKLHDMLEQAIKDVDRATKAMNDMDFNRAQDKISEGYNETVQAYASLNETARIMKDSCKSLREGILTIIEPNPKTAKRFRNRGYNFKKAEKYNEAIQDYGKAIELDPKDAWSFIGRGDAYVAQGKYEEAIRDYSKAVGVDPKNAWSFIGRGKTCAKQKKYDDAILDYNRAIELNPKSSLSFTRRGLAYAGKGKYDEAIRDYDEAVELDPKNVLNFRNRGTAYVNKGKYDEAIRDYDKAIELDSQDVSSFRNRGFAYAKKGRYDEAIRDYGKAIEIDPKNESAYNSRGFAFLESGILEKAESDFKKALELNPNNNSVLVSMAELYSAKKDIGEACKWLKRGTDSGFKDWNYVKTYHTFDNLKNTDCYKEIVDGK